MVLTLRPLVPAVGFQSLGFPICNIGMTVVPVFGGCGLAKWHMNSALHRKRAQ